MFHEFASVQLQGLKNDRIIRSDLSCTQMIRSPSRNCVWAASRV